MPARVRCAEVELVGRQAECELVRSLLATARAGTSAVLVIRGEPGVGKTTLLDYAVSRAEGMRVLRVAGTEAESDLAFAGLYGLLRPTLDMLDQVAPVQAAALAGALGLAPAASSDRFLVSAGALGLLAAAAQAGPVLCVVDDAQWLDRPSVDALVFAARRFAADPVALIFAAAEIEGELFDARGLDELRIGGLDDVNAAAILDAHVPGIVPPVRRRLLAEAAGNALALLELPAALTEAQLLGREALPGQMPLTPRLRAIFQRQVEGLPPGTQTALLLAALEGTGEVATVLSAGERLGLSAEAFGPAEEAGLIETRDDRISFRHPLIRSALAEAAAMSERQRVHAALAEALSGEAQIDRRVWHQAMAALTGDEEVAIALEESARRAQARGGHASASVAFVRAAELTGERSRFAPRLAAAARAAWNAGEVERARELTSRALRFAEGDLEARLLHLQGLVEIAGRRVREGAETLLKAARSSGDPSQTLEILVDTLEPALQSGFPQELAVEMASQAERLQAASPADAFNRLVVLWYGRQCARRLDAARAVWDEAMRLAAEIDDDARVQYWAATLASLGLIEGAGLGYARRAVELARRQGRLDLLPILTGRLAYELVWASLFDEACAEAGEGAELAAAMGVNPAWHLLTLARVAAIHGDGDATRKHLDEAVAFASDPLIGMETARGALLGLLELGCGNPATAVEFLLDAFPGERRNGAGVAAIPDLIEAMTRSGSATEQAEAALERLREAATPATRARNALVARCEALLGTRPPAEAFGEAIELADALSPFERARTQLLNGEWLRRERRRKEARTQLRAAAEEFRRLGAQPWQDRAETELRATGETARRREPSTRAQLTPQELQIARLAAQGHTNPEIAAQLFLSPRTVEYHLRKVFSKLAIAGRSDLIRRGADAVYGGLE